MQKPSTLQFSFCVSILFHLVLFGACGVFIFSTSKPKLQQDDNSAVLTLVAAPAETAAPSPVVKAVAPVQPMPLEKPVEKPIVVESSKPPLPPEPPVVRVAQPRPVAVVIKTVTQTILQGDASSSKPEKDLTTTKAQPSVEAKPNYLKNPEPDYPESARRRHEAGLVLLAVTVTAQGHPAHVEIKNSSGFALLDDAALEAVRQWEFEPARVGSLVLESKIEVPVRFELTPQ